MTTCVTTSGEPSLFLALICTIVQLSLVARGSAERRTTARGLRKHTFKNLQNFVQSSKLLVFSDKILHVCISSKKPRVCQKPGGSPGVD